MIPTARIAPNKARKCETVALCAIIAWNFADFARADGPLGPNGSAITTSNYSIDLTRSPFFGSTRMTGMGGASVAIAEGVEGGLTNPAAVASRAPQWPDRLDYWLAFGMTYPLASGDFFNSGDKLEAAGDTDEDNFLFFLPGAMFEIGHFGFGASIDSTIIKINDVDLGTSTETVRLNFVTTHLQFGYGFMDGQIVAGLGARIVTQRFLLGQNALAQKDLFYRGLGGNVEAGILVRPHDKRWRLGASLFPRLRTNTKVKGIATKEADGDIVAVGAFLPDTTEIPWHGNIGFAYQFGKRPTNQPLVLVEDEAASDLAEIDRREQVMKEEEHMAIAKERAKGGDDVEKRVASIKKSFSQAYENLDELRDFAMHKAWQRLRHRFRYEWNRRYVLLNTDLGLTGQTDNAVGVESFIVQEVQRSGQKLVASPHLGLETEIWPQRMKLRAGTYWEPTRFEDTKGRMHGTLGLDIRVLNWDVFKLWPEDYEWQIGTAFDIARDYQVMSVTIGGWY